MLPDTLGLALSSCQPMHTAGRCLEGDRLKACQLHYAGERSSVPKPPPFIAQAAGCS